MHNHPLSPSLLLPLLLHFLLLLLLLLLLLAMPLLPLHLLLLPLHLQEHHLPALLLKYLPLCSFSGPAGSLTTNPDPLCRSRHAPSWKLLVPEGQQQGA